MSSLSDLSLKGYVLRGALRPASFAVLRPTMERIFAWRGLRDGDADLDSVRTILVVRLDEIGDVVLTMPMLRALRHRFPSARITLVVKPGLEGLVETCPFVDDVLTFAGGHNTVRQRIERAFDAQAFSRDQLWSRHIDLAIVPRWSADAYTATWLAFSSGARLRVGYSERVAPDKARENYGNDSLLTHTIDQRGVAHEVERGLNVVRFLGGEVRDTSLQLWPTRTDRAVARRLLLVGDGDAHDAFLVLAPGAGVVKRRWPWERFAAVGRELAQSHGYRLVVIGGHEDVEEANAIKERIGGDALSLAGRTTLRETCAVLELASCVVCNDSGPMHLASAMATPSVVLSCHPRGADAGHANPPDRFGPWGSRHVLLQPSRHLPPCTDGCDAVLAHCIKSNQVREAVDAVASLLPPRVQEEESKPEAPTRTDKT